MTPSPGYYEWLAMRTRRDAFKEGEVTYALLIEVKVVTAVNHELVHLVERALIDEQIDALTRRELALLVLLSDALGTYTY